MQGWGPQREVEKIPATKTARHQALKLEANSCLSRLREAALAWRTLYGRDEPVTRLMEGTALLIERLSAELKVPKS